MLLYDINVYVDGDEILNLSAYELLIQGEGFTTNTEKYHTLKIPMTRQYHEEIAYLLDNEDWVGEDWEDHDWWHTTEYLTEGDTPVMLKEWVESLPNYELKEIF